MTKVNFKSSENLLKSVITRQAGEPIKAVSELIQNAIDGITEKWKKNHKFKGEIHISLTDAPQHWVLSVEDNGIGIGKTKKELTETFSTFGLSQKQDDPTLLGEFGMGRGQAISLIYDPTLDCLNGSIEVESNSYRLKDFRIDSELSFGIEKMDEFLKGTRWTISSKRSILNETSLRRFLQENVITEIPMYLNGNKIERKVLKDRKAPMIETDTYMIWIDSKAEYFDIFDRGLKVAAKEFIPGWGGVILSKVPLYQNFARNDIIGGDKTIQSASDAIQKAIEKEISSYTNKKRLTQRQRNGVFKLLTKTTAQRWKNVKFITLTNDKVVSLKELAGAEIYMASHHDKTADRLNQIPGIFVIQDNQHTACLSSVINKMIRYYSKAKPSSVAYKHLAEVSNHHHQILKPDKNQAKLLAVMNKAFELEKRKMVFGKAKGMAGWTDGRSYMALEISYVNTKLERYQKSGLYNLLVSLHGTVAHEMAHDRSDLITMEHSYGFQDSEISWRDQEINHLLTIPAGSWQQWESELGWDQNHPIAAKTSKPTSDKSTKRLPRITKILPGELEIGGTVSEIADRLIAKMNLSLSDKDRNRMNTQIHLAIWRMEKAGAPIIKDRQGRVIRYSLSATS